MPVCSSGPWRVGTLALLALFGAPLVMRGSPLQAQEPHLAILFVGNSLTYFNDLPGMVGTLLSEAGTTGRIGVVAGPDMGLEDHWRRGVVFDSLRAGGWDVVVMQQGPSATEGRPSLLEYSARFADSIRAYGARPALYMVWPAERRSFDFAGVAESYRMAAQRVDGMLFPVGEAWLQVMENDPTIPLYGPDRFHPTPAATFLAALIIAEQLAGREVPGGGIDSGQASSLGLTAGQRAALRRTASWVRVR